MKPDADVLAESRAVLVGVSAYEYAEFSPIRAARNSLEAMRSLLSDPALCAWPPGRITTIANPVSAADLATNIADLAESTTGVLLLYYVGHGVLWVERVGGCRFLCCRRRVHTTSSSPSSNSNHR